MARRRPKKEESDGGGNVELLFLQLMMVMLAFFILLSSLAVIVDEKRMEAVNSLTGAFGSYFPVGGNVEQGKGSSVPVPGMGLSGVTAKRTAKDLTEVSKLLGLGDAVNVLPLDKETVRVRLRERIMFHPGSVKLDPAVLPFLDIMADILHRPEIIEITIQGYTDETPVHGSSYASNWELSAARAMQVFLALAKRGVPKGRMVVAGMGDNHPLPESETHGDNSLNRRVEVVLRFRPVTEKEKVHHAPVTPHNKPGHATSAEGAN